MSEVLLEAALEGGSMRSQVQRLWRYGSVATIFFVLSLFISLGSRVQTGEAANPLIGPLSTMGNQIVNAQGSRVRLMGVNWPGFESDDMAPEGLDRRGYKSMLDQMKSLGFNIVRIPFSSETLEQDAETHGINATENADLVGLAPLQVLDKIVDYAGAIGLGVVLVHQRLEAGSGPDDTGVWYSSKFPESRFISDWETLATRYRGRTHVIGFDLHSEPSDQAIWGDSGGLNPNDWRATAERAARRVQAANPDVLIVVEGVENHDGTEYWPGGNLQGVDNVPWGLPVPNKLVYSPHEYPPSFQSKPWFAAPGFPSNLPGVFRENWGFIYESNTAPVFVGSFGSPLESEQDLAWINQIVSYLNTTSGNACGISWAWWSWGPSSDPDLGGVLQSDWQTPDPETLAALRPLMTGAASDCPAVSQAPIPSPSASPGLSPSPGASPTVAPTSTPTPTPTPTPTVTPTATPPSGSPTPIVVQPPIGPRPPGVPTPIILPEPPIVLPPIGPRPPVAPTPIVLPNPPRGDIPGVGPRSPSGPQPVPPPSDLPPVAP